MPTEKQLKDVTKRGEALHDAIKAENVEDVKRLCKSDVVNFPERGAGWTPLHQAAYKGNLPIAVILLQENADLETVCGSCGGTPLHLACSR